MKFAVPTAILACTLAGCIDAQDPTAPDAGESPDMHYVATLSDGSPSPVVFEIDCSRLSEPSKSNCKPFIENTAHRAFPALRKITGIELENRCPVMRYEIYSYEDWPYTGAGGVARGDCQIDYLVDAVDSKYAAGYFGPYDMHELLHQHQYLVTALTNDRHPLFASTQAEVEREIGDEEALEQSLELMTAAASDTHPTTECRIAQYRIESALYLNNPNVVYGFYQMIRPDITDTSTQVSYLLYEASGRDEAVKKALRDGGCSGGFAK